MAEYIDYEESLYLLPYPSSPNPPTPVPSHPFPFLKLPREIRDLIYYYALLRPRGGPSVNPTDICYFHARTPANSTSHSYWTPYWGTRESTRLFLVNRQVSNEALEVFYSTYPFHFPTWVDVPFVNATIRDTLSPWARTLITKIGFKAGLFCNPLPHSLRDEEETRQTIEAVVELLPNLKQVVLSLCLSGHDVLEYQVKDVVARALRIASPLRGFAGLYLEEFDELTAQRTRIMSEVREALGAQRAGRA